ncbi:thiamine-phosphate kinase [Candidatus Neoehrlichia procyonis]|uniref:Thiamine-monophosphate kinase n=1 Tax=Candidatus Neoehrlichia procyonis str. RAC413 TaxID=1359163 RepID=A0A0F3NL91_9RICK|nr:thiamine-phosphate kinase [Candidatus Neoehrlichia lotoris]KJV68833.1 thiamine-monophosphate kinase [Candidatus Neoehrlichia lotoris str. RAC413]
MNEFSYIKKYIHPLDHNSLIGNDAAQIANLQDKLIITKDILVEGVHFLDNNDPKLLAKKSLRVNLSDIASMGIKPYGYLLGLILPNNITNKWWKEFTSGLKEDNDQFNIKLIGGDTTQNNNNSIIISITAFGFTNNTSLTRSKANVGDYIYVSGNIGDAALGLLAYRNIINNKHCSYFKNKFDLPNPRINLGLLINDYNIASSCIDISDGLIQDIEHICQSSYVEANIYIDKIPLSKEAKIILNNNPQLLETILTGGDDYELVFTSHPKNHIKIKDLSSKIGVKVTQVGYLSIGNNVNIYNHNNQKILFTKKGFQHFSN